MPSGKEIKAACEAMIRDMFIPAEMPLSAEITAKYWSTAKRALEAAERVRNPPPRDERPSEVIVREMRDEWQSGD